MHVYELRIFGHFWPPPPVHLIVDQRGCLLAFPLENHVEFSNLAYFFTIADAYAARIYSKNGTFLKITQINSI